MNKTLTYIFIGIFLISCVSAYVPQDQQRAVDEFKEKYDFDKVVFSDTDLINNTFNTFAYYSYKYKNKHTIVNEEITIFPLSQELTISRFKCLLEHEYGHRLEALNSKNLRNDLSESFADDYMQSVYHVCERFYE